MASGKDKNAPAERLFGLVRENWKKQTFARVGVELCHNSDPTNSVGGPATECPQQRICGVSTLLLSPVSDETLHFFPSVSFYHQYWHSFFVVTRVCKALLSCRAESESLCSCVEKITPIFLLIVWVTVFFLTQLVWVNEAFSLLNSCIFIRSRPVMETGSSSCCLNSCGT